MSFTAITKTPRGFGPRGRFPITVVCRYSKAGGEIIFNDLAIKELGLTIGNTYEINIGSGADVEYIMIRPSTVGFTLSPTRGGRTGASPGGFKIKPLFAHLEHAPAHRCKTYRHGANVYIKLPAAFIAPQNGRDSTVQTSPRALAMTAAE